MPNFVRQGGCFVASAFNYNPAPVLIGSASGTNVLITIASSPVVSAADGTPFTPFSTSNPVTFGVGLSTAETVTPSVVSYVAVPGAVQLTVTTANVHNAGESVVSGSAGLQEAISYVANTVGAGTVVLDPSYLGTAAQVNAAVGNANVTIEDTRTGINIRPSVIAINAQAAIPVASGTYVITKGSAGAYTLAAPVSGSDDGKYVVVVAQTAFAHTVTTPANKINGNKLTATFAAAIGNNVELVAYQGVWYCVLPSTGITLT
jgi:hypothetical protein